ncbi:hypothetical protein BDV95DRAFT_601085 [Massariosphaeria phaeospora]|uniref:F-box domain-containing protein n=1 Tax=Massariosphaeria phaeospora TaxID=100035 RepID=A0A7C8MHH3_9PLEO|nr:hypothetical protein BDV95DRAFT_601085 [Massariosphaeria phaeospora]
MKRVYSDKHGERPNDKRLRRPNPDRMSKLSEEILVRILSFLPVATLIDCQRVSTKFARLAVDVEVWKAAYYNEFVLPRASRIPGIRYAAGPDPLLYSSKAAKWLDDRDLVKKGANTNWKQQYRLRHNWARGNCAVSEIVITKRTPAPPLLVLMHKGILFIADSVSGLRAWNTKDRRALLACTTLAGIENNTPRLPTSLAVDCHNIPQGPVRVVVGFEDGSLTAFGLSREDGMFTKVFSRPPSANGCLTALAYASPYLLTMTEDHVFSIYDLKEEAVSHSSPSSPRLLHSLRSHTAWPPMSLSLRTATNHVTASIAYSIPTLHSGWTVGIQETLLSHEGELLESRTAMEVYDPSHCLSGSSSLSSPPTSMSYTHPYLLVTRPDNTLAFYVVTSTASALSISPGSRLWGHTSSVSGVHVGVRGKAVSVSRLGDELRVWDLEGAVTNGRPDIGGEFSVRVQPARTVVAEEKLGLRFFLDQSHDDSTISRGWVGFDEQNVVVLREKRGGGQSLAVYDFS